jgi:hypothetical protein
VTPAHTPVRDTRGWSTSVAAQTTSRVGPRVGLVAPRYVILEDIWDFGGESSLDVIA